MYKNYAVMGLFLLGAMVLPGLVSAQSSDTPPVKIIGCTPDLEHNPLHPPLGELSTLDCTLENMGTAPTSVFIVITRKLDTAAGEAPRVRIPLVSLRANESTTTQILMPGIFENGSYTYAVRLAAAVGPADYEKEGALFGDTITLQGSMNSPSVKIASATLDKDSYVLGEAAKLSLTVVSPQGATTSWPYNLDILSTDGAGHTCETLLHEGPVSAEQAEYAFPIRGNPLCKASFVKVRVLSLGGLPVDSKDFAISPIGGEKIPKTLQYLNLAIGLGGAILLLGSIALAYYYVRRRISRNKETLI